MFKDLFVVNDGFDALLLGSLFFGLIFSALSLMIGAFDFGGFHLGHGHGHGHGGHGGHGAHAQDTAVTVFNIATILAFVTWFGGCTYLLRNGAGIPLLISAVGGVAGGVFGGYLIFKLLRWFKSQERHLDARNEQLTGSIGRVTSPIRAGGVGEIVYELNGVRQVSAAKCLGDVAIGRGADVMVLRRERGIALVEPWKPLSDEDDWERRLAQVTASGEAHPPPGRSLE